ncbi:PqqD family protein [Allosalinactinospora lopnorensis]|uniref:PqqD family protein n=1 Tax=Allosalinactinospora lopnorensis TaxID=1352348 RepID=UPI000623D951|nr:PqqD family protein [Allosalinactinospora lopnorensis]
MTTVAPAPNVHFVTTEDGAVLLNLATGRFFGLNPTTAAIWNRITAGTDIEAITAELAPELGITPGRLSADTCRLVEALRNHGLLRGGKEQ